MAAFFICNSSWVSFSMRITYDVSEPDLRVFKMLYASLTRAISRVAYSIISIGDIGCVKLVGVPIRHLPVIGRL